MIPCRRQTNKFTLVKSNMKVVLKALWFTDVFNFIIKNWSNGHFIISLAKYFWQTAQYRHTVKTRPTFLQLLPAYFQTKNTIQLEVLREHKPPPIQRIRISEFGLPDPKRDLDRHQNCITWSLAMPSPSKKFCQNPFTSLRVIWRTDRQTNRQTNRPKQKHNLLLRQR